MFITIDFGGTGAAILAALKTLIAQGESLMASQAELTAAVQAATEKLTKIGTETSTLLQKITDLEAVITAGPPVSAELQAAVAALTAQAQVVDDLVVDSPPPTP